MNNSTNNTQTNDSEYAVCNHCGRNIPTSNTFCPFCKKTMLPNINEELNINNNAESDLKGLKKLDKTHKVLNKLRPFLWLALLSLVVFGNFLTITKSYEQKCEFEPYIKTDSHNGKLVTADVYFAYPIAQYNTETVIGDTSLSRSIVGKYYYGTTSEDFSFDDNSILLFVNDEDLDAFEKDLYATITQGKPMKVFGHTSTPDTATIDKSVERYQENELPSLMRDDPLYDALSKHEGIDSLTGNILETHTAFKVNPDMYEGYTQTIEKKIPLGTILAFAVLIMIIVCFICDRIVLYKLKNKLQKILNYVRKENEQDNN